MSVDKLKLIRYALTAIMGIMFFIGMQFITDVHGKEVTFFESFFIAILITGLNLSIWSDWLYNSLSEEKIKIKYKTFQKFGIIMAVFCLNLVGGVLHNEMYNGELSILSLFIMPILVYITLMFV